MNQFSCFMMGEGTLLVQCADALLQRGHTIHGIISANPQITEWATNQGIQIIHPADDLVAALQPQPFDYFFSVANLAIIPDALLALPSQYSINFHDGPLPHYAGLNTPAWALMNRETTYGITWHIMGTEVDAGDILKQVIFDLVEGETSFTLNARNYQVATASFAELIDELADDTVQPVKQPTEGKNWYGKNKRPAAAGVLTLNQDAEDIAALVRALDFGVADRYTNPLLLPKLVVNEMVYLVPEIEVTDTESTDDAGTVVAVNGGVQIATQTYDVIFPRWLTVDGQPVTDLDAIISEGDVIADLDAEHAGQLTEFNKTVVKHEEFWLNRLAKLEPGEPPYVQRDPEYRGAFEYESLAMPLLPGSSADFVTAAFADYLARINNASTFDIGFRDSTQNLDANFFATYVPLHVNVQPLEDGVQAVLNELATVRQRKTYPRDLLARYPELKMIREHGVRYPIVIEQVESFDRYTPQPGSELTLLIAQDGSQCVWVYQTPTLSRDAVTLMQHQFGAFLVNIANGNPANTVSLLTPDEFQQIVYGWNATAADYPTDVCIPHLFAAQAERTPNQVAAVFENQEITYSELNRRANQLARHLRKLGVGPDTLVGLYMERSLDMVVGLMGIHKAGGAYVPLDPSYPADRIAFMVEDSQVPVLLTQARLVKHLPQHNAQVVCIDSDWPVTAREADSNFDSGVQPHNLAYTIYTSGSTGKPKGVMIEHRNVVNFFAGMDARIGTEPGTWLAVTSLSFDISVLEIFWTLTRGFKVVIYVEDRSGTSSSAYSGQQIDFSLFYFASDEGENVADKYELLLEGAKYGDEHGFAAVWTPERHFYAFGGLYPNPSVAGAAIAAVTKRIHIRAGSCVIPLHNPIRIAEEWALVDNLSKGRVGISFAAGWQPNDFVLRPETFADRNDVMYRDIETVRRLWRGETINFPGPNDKEYPVRTLPRPVQADLPSWVTIAGNPKSFQRAGENGFRILTHLLGQSVEELAEKLEIYRTAWHEAGHPGNGYVTLMLHTFVGDDDEEVREIVRKPMTKYLSDSLDLTEKAAWSFPAFKQRAESTGMSLREMFAKQALSDDEKAAVLNFAFERYFETSGLFGTVETCLKMVEKLKALHIDEIGCLIDFGVPSPLAMKHLEYLNEVREIANAPAPAGDFSFAAQVEQHQVTHLQCTPSMANMLLRNEDTRPAFAKLQKLMIGGEAFPVALAQELQEIVPGDIINMYGPTETTIWSSTYQLQGQQEIVPIGTPIANTQLYVLDRNQQPAPVGVVGELFIGGHGVVRGYLNRPELTAQRFVADPFVAENRMYRTGDLARSMPNGMIEFLGRNDFQVKIRGYRIELGEIEKLIDQHPAVAQSVVIAREDVPGDKRLVAYIIPRAGYAIQAAEMRDHLRVDLPEFMIPSHFKQMSAFPLTPNLKIDRNALPAPDQVESQDDANYVPPQSDIEEQIAAIWREVLNVPSVGVNDNFFDLGGHSLLTVEAHRRLKQAFETDLTVTDLFRYTTIRSLVGRLSTDDEDGGNGQSSVQKSLSRADRRKQVRGRR